MGTPGMTLEKRGRGGTPYRWTRHVPFWSGRNHDRAAIVNDPQPLSIITQVISGVEYCHFHSIVHRDLKPGGLCVQNLLYSAMTMWRITTT